MIVSNHMLGRDPSDFREPDSNEMAEACDAIVESYIHGDDCHDLQAYLAEVTLENLSAQTRLNKCVPFIAFETIVYKAAMEMAAKWDAEQWGRFRERATA